MECYKSPIDKPDLHWSLQCVVDLGTVRHKHSFIFTGRNHSNPYHPRTLPTVIIVTRPKEILSRHTLKIIKTCCMRIFLFFYIYFFLFITCQTLFFTQLSDYFFCVNTCKKAWDEVSGSNMSFNICSNVPSWPAVHATSRATIARNVCVLCVLPDASFSKTLFQWNHLEPDTME